MKKQTLAAANYKAPLITLEELIEPLEKACSAYLADVKAKYKAQLVPLGELIESFTEFCGKSDADNIAGVDISKDFILSKANLSETDTSKYKLVKPGYFACNLMHIGRNEVLPVAYNDSKQNYIVSPAYYVFHIKKTVRERVLSEYLFILFKSKELDRLTWFYTDSSIRGNLKEDYLFDIQIPLPPPDVQQAIVAVYHCTEEARSIAKAAREKLKKMCPAIIQKAAVEG